MAKQSDVLKSLTGWLSDNGYAYQPTSWSEISAASDDEFVKNLRPPRTLVGRWLEYFPDLFVVRKTGDPTTMAFFCVVATDEPLPQEHLDTLLKYFPASVFVVTLHGRHLYASEIHSPVESRPLEAALSA